MGVQERRSARRADAPPSMEQMGSIFRSCGIQLEAHQLRQFWDYHNLLRERNSELNLTRVRNFANMVLKLYVDSVLPAEMLDLPSPLLDLGTGPGMPGIPIKIYRPGIEILLAERRAKRIEFLNLVVRQLRLPGTRVIGAGVSSRFEMPVAAVITRAVEPVDVTLERVRGCLMPGGRVIFMKGPHCEPEIERARTRFEEQYDLVLDRPYVLPGTHHQRRLLVYRRMDEPLYNRRAHAETRHAVRIITSPQNPLFKGLKKLLSTRGIRKAGQALVSGGKPITDILARHPQRCEAWLSPEDRLPPPLHSPGHLDWIQLAPALFQELDIFGTRTPMLLINLPEITPWEPEEHLPAGCSLVIPFQDPENVGAAIRSAAAFGAAQVILLAESAHPFHPKALRASGGSGLNVRLRQGPGLGDLPLHLPVVALSAEGADIRSETFPPAFALLAGLEGAGLPETWRRRSVRIPIHPDVESLNAAAAVSVALYEWRRRVGS